MRPRNIPLVMHPAKPLNRLVTVGLLPEPIRAQFGYSWSPRQQRLSRRRNPLTADGRQLG